MTSTTARLGRLVRVELREAWASEAGDFTPWLAQAENIELLGDTIGVDLEVEAQEKNVGPFRADILCKDTATGHWVLIENQLERTDHIHLGQLITYAAGLNAVTIVWIAHRFTEEHRAALDWLNEITSEGITFFGLEVELWRIGESQVAPKFNLISSPNDWSQQVAQGAKNAESEALTPAKELQLEFWTSFRDYVQSRGASFKPTKPFPANWMTIAIGRSGFRLSAVASMYDSAAESFDQHELRAELELYDQNAKSYFAQLLQLKPQIEQQMGEPLTWYNSESRKGCKVFFRTLANLEDRSLWPKYHEWLRVKLNSLKNVIGPIVKKLDATQVSGVFA